MNKIDLNGQVAVVTGGASGFGLASAKRFIESGARVSLWDRDPAALKQAVELLGDGTSSEVVDITDYSGLEAAHARKAVLTTSDSGGVLELVKDGVNGLVVPPYPMAIAAYNAGASPVSRWWMNDRGDRLLWIESIPYWETRYYVPAVLRNMWVYQSLAGAATPTLTSMVQHKWPAFPVSRTNLMVSTQGGAPASR